ncbi:MAG: FHA domain-containing protein [Planctomycetota bacterium]|nr:FHA domain-containing protein [Planctomycetota bacterium]
MKASLILVTEDGKSREIPLSKGQTTIGRESDCAIRVPVSSVSRHHCQVRLEGDMVKIADLKSSNGTYVNRALIAGEKELVAGDVINVGPAVFVIRINGDPAEVDAKATYELGNAGTLAASKGAARGTAMGSPTDGVATASAPRKIPGSSGGGSKPPAGRQPAAPGVSPMPIGGSAGKQGKDDAEDDLMGSLSKSDGDDSSVFDFDFKDDDNAPKL